jgi:hypothetical protein
MPTIEPDLAARLRRLADVLPVLESSTEADFGAWVKSSQREVDLDAIRSALATGDPIALYALDREYAPFWCPTCGSTYCPDHWVIWEERDEGFYDCTRGRCPEGHVRILDD